MAYNPKSLAEEVQELVRISGTGQFLVDALQKGAILVLLLPPKAKIAELVRQSPPAEAVKVVALFHVVNNEEFEMARKSCSESESETMIDTASGYPLTIVCADASRSQSAVSNVLELSDISSTPVKVAVGQSGLSIKVYRIGRVLMPLPGSQEGNEFAGSSIDANEFAPAGASLNYVGPDLKIEYADFLKDGVGFGIFAMESIRQTLLSASRVAYGSSVVAGKVISKAPDYDEKMFTFNVARVSLIATQVTTNHSALFATSIAGFLAAVLKAWPYLKGKTNVGNKIEFALSGTQKNEAGYKEALIKAGYGKKKLIGKSTALVSELEPIAVLLGTTLGQSKAVRTFSDYLTGFAYMLENDWKTANNFFDDAAEHGHEWITSEWKK